MQLPTFSPALAHTHTHNTHTTPCSNLNLQFQAVSYILVGLAEVCTAITYYDLFYTEVPASMRSVCQAINMLTTSFGTCTVQHLLRSVSKRASMLFSSFGGADMPHS